MLALESQSFKICGIIIYFTLCQALDYTSVIYSKCTVMSSPWQRVVLHHVTLPRQRSSREEVSLVIRSYIVSH